jgi:hypothetical protein
MYAFVRPTIIISRAHTTQSHASGESHAYIRITCIHTHHMHTHASHAYIRTSSASTRIRDGWMKLIIHVYAHIYTHTTRTHTHTDTHLVCIHTNKRWLDDVNYAIEVLWCHRCGMGKVSAYVCMYVCMYVCALIRDRSPLES